MKKFFIRMTILLLVSSILAFSAYEYIKSTLPKLITLGDYQPLLVSQVFDRNNKKIGEFFRERRILVPFKKIPKNVINAFLAAEDSTFFQHKGINYLAILRAQLANLKAGHTVQGGSTITQQVAKTLMLSNERTFIRKVKDVLLAMEMEDHLSKEDILYLYLNQIYFGQGAYGVEMAAETYFRKTIENISLEEAAILAGLPKAPSAYSPVTNPTRAKERQVYVLNRMAEVGFITKEEAVEAISKSVKVYLREKYQDYAPFYLETVRQLLIGQLGEDTVLNQGLRIYTGLDLKKQLAAQESAMKGLKELDKRQGYRGPLQNAVDPKGVSDFLVNSRNKLIGLVTSERIIQPDGHFKDYGPINLQYDVYRNGLPFYLRLGDTVEGIVSKIDDRLGLTYVKVAEVEGLIDINTMQWARKLNFNKDYYLDLIKKPSQALKIGDIVQVKIVGEKFSSARLQKVHQGNTSIPDFSKFVSLELDQEPIAESALLSVDQETQDILAMIGGINFEKSQYNRALQAARQTGSSFKTIVYASALDHGFTASTPVMDAPIVYRESRVDEEGQETEKVWKPANHSKTFSGDTLFRTALVKSLNIPSVKIIEEIGVDWAAQYARRLGVFSPLNMDFTLVLGSSSLTLYEMTKVFSQFGRQGKRTRPILIHRVEDKSGKKLIEQVSLDLRFQKELEEYDQKFETQRKTYIDSMTPSTADPNNKSVPDGKDGNTVTTSSPPTVAASSVSRQKLNIEPNIFFKDPDQLVKPQTAYLITSLLKGVIEDSHGTGARAKVLGREVAGKTGSTNGYYDAWFIGYSPQIATGVWVGFDQERTLGKGEVGSRAALPIWIDYMKSAHEGLPQEIFPVPNGIVFANIDSETGALASSTSSNVIRQAYLEGTEPTLTRNQKEEDTDFYKQDLNE